MSAGSIRTADRMAAQHRPVAWSDFKRQAIEFAPDTAPAFERAEEISAASDAMFDAALAHDGSYERARERFNELVRNIRRPASPSHERIG